MSWQTLTNNVDCNVYAMRHMETYMGQSVKAWKFGVSASSKRAMKHLRVQYCRQLIGSALNHLDEDIFDKTKTYFVAHCKENNFDLVKFIDGHK